MADESPKPTEAEQKEPPTTSPPAPPPAPSTGRPAFRDLRPELSDKDLESPITSKFLLEMLRSAEIERDDYRQYMQKYFAADKRADLAAESAKPNKINEIMSNFGIGLGCAIIGLAPFFWEIKARYGTTCLIVGFLLVVGSTFGRIKYR
jgi:hypothetical protein